LVGEEEDLAETFGVEILHPGKTGCKFRGGVGR